MKKFLAIALLGGLTLVGCGDYNEDNFEGLDDVVKLENVQTLTYTLTESDYALMASKATSMASGEAAAALKSIGTLQAFSEEYPASEYVPYFLAYTGGEFFTLSDESSVKLTYNYQAETPENIKMLSQMTAYTLSADDYKEIWGSEEDFINGVSDSKLSKITSVIPTEEIAPGDYVVVTYNHAVAEPVFGSEEPEQPGEPGEPEEPTNNYTSVLGSAALGDTVVVKGYVSAVCTQGIVVTDNTGSILVYKNTDFALGDVVTVSGPISSYNKGFQFDTSNGDITVTKDGEVEVTYPEPMVIDGAKADELVTRSADEYLVFVKMTGTVSISGDGKYYNVAIEGATASQGSFYGITDEHKALVANGEVATIYGYLSSISSGKYVNIIATHINEEPTVTPGEPEEPVTPAGPTISDILALGVGGTVAAGTTIEATVISNMALNNLTSKKGLYVQDATGGLQFYLAANHEFAFGDKLKIDLSGVSVAEYNGAIQISGLALDKFELLSSGNAVEAKKVSIDDFLANKYEGQYVEIEGVQVVESQLTNTWVMGGAHTSITFEHTSGAEFVVFSSKYATYGAETVAQGSGSVKGIAAINKGTVQIIFGQATDYAGLTGARFGGGTTPEQPETPETPVTPDPSGSGYTKITSIDQLTAGTYLIVWDSQSPASVFNGQDAVNGYEAATVVNGVISDNMTSCEVTIEAVGDGYSLKVAAGYMSGTSGSNKLNFGAEAAINHITFTADGNVDIESNTSVLRFNAASNQLRFRYYKSASYSAQTPIALYKKM